MSYIGVCCFLVICAAAVFADDIVYPKGLEGVDIEAVKNNKRLLKNYVNCCIGKGPCTPQGEKLKNVIADALSNNCAKCTQEQRDTAEDLAKHLITKHFELWKLLQDKFDADGNFRREYCPKYNHLENSDKVCVGFV